MAYILLMINVLIMTSGQLFFKRSADYIIANPDMRFPMNYISNPWFYIAIFMYIISTFVWTQVLTRLPLSVAYPIVSLSYILTLAGAYFIFHEDVSRFGVIGVLLIMAGITLTALR